MTDLWQSLQDQSSLGSITVLLVGFSLQPHLLSLCLSHRLDGAGFSLTNEADLLSLCLGCQHLLCPGQKKQHCLVYTVIWRPLMIT